MLFPRRRFLQLAASAVALPAGSRILRAETYPTRPVTLVVFAPAGGGPDIRARILGQALSQRVGQPVIVENRPGAGGNLAVQAVARAPADGYTLLLVATPQAIDAALHKQVNVVKDIAPVAGVCADPFVMLTNPALPFKTVRELIAHAKANPGQINLTSSGSGNLSHLTGEMFRMMTGIDVIHVPYKGTVAALAGLRAGEVHFMFDSLPSAVPHLQSAQLRALAITSAKRIASMPEIPTVGEFVPGFEMVGLLGVGAPKTTAVPIIDRLNAEINAVLADREVSDRLVGSESTSLSGNPTSFGKLIQDTADKWAPVLKFAGIKAN